MKNQVDPIILSSSKQNEFSKQIIEFTDFDTYHKQNNLPIISQLLKLIKNSSPLDLIDPLKTKFISIKFEDYLKNEILTPNFRAPNCGSYSPSGMALRAEYVDLINSFLPVEQSIDIQVYKFNLKLKKISDDFYKSFSNKNKVTEYYNFFKISEWSTNIIGTPNLDRELVEKFPIPESEYYQKQIILTQPELDRIIKLLPNYLISTIKIFTNYDTPEEFVYNKILNEDYLKLQELQKNILPLEIFRSKIKYHSAQMKDNGEQYSLIEVLNKDQGIIRVSDTLHNFLIKSTVTNLSKIMPKMWYGADMILDEYAGLLAINGNISIGFIFKPENAILNLFNNHLVKIEDFKTGIVNIRTCELDLKGYKGQLTTDLMLELGQSIESAKVTKESEKIKLIKVEQNLHHIKQEILQLNQNIIKLSNDFHAVFIEEQLTTLNNQYQEVTNHLQEQINLINFEEVNILGTTINNAENIDHY